MKLKTLSAVVICSALLTACQTPPDIKKLQDQNTTLEQRLSKANSEIGTLQADKKSLENDNAELNRVISVLGQEKSSHVESSINLRSEVRQFVQMQVDALKQFLLDSDLLDYVGGELVMRPSMDAEPMLVVDLSNPAPRSGVLTGVGGYFKQTGSFTVKVMRQVGEELVVVWESQPVAVEEVGIQRLNFAISVGIQKGDFLAYAFPAGGIVGYDRGTASTRFTQKAVGLGETIRLGALDGADERRAYSVGVFGLLNRE